MVLSRDNAQKHLKRHAVTTVLVCAAVPVGAIRMRAAIVIALAGKEAAP
jgi:hypothetical protein